MPSTYFYFLSKLNRFNVDYNESLKNLLKRDSVNKIIARYDSQTSNQSQYRLVDQRKRELKITLLKSQLENETLENKFLILGLAGSILIILLLRWIWRSSSHLNKRLRVQYQIIKNQHSEIESRNKEQETIA